MKTFNKVFWIVFLYFNVTSIYGSIDFLKPASYFSPPSNIYYVSNSGDDNNTGLSLVEAFKTIQKASDVVVAGDQVLIENGTYVGFDHRSASGTASLPIAFKTLGNNVLINLPGPIRDDGINIEGVDYIILDGFITNNMPGNGNGIRVVLSNNTIVRNCSCDNNAERGIFTAFTDDILIEYNTCSNSIDEHGIYVSNSSDRPIIRYNECFGNNAIGIHMNGDLSQGGDGIISDAQVYGNILHDNNKAAGINLDGVKNPIIYNNLIYNNHDAQGIVLFQGDGAIVSNGAKIYNNTILVPNDGRWGILVKDGGNIGTEIYNNIIINQHAWRGAIAVENLTDFASNYNVLSDKMSAVGDGSTISLSEWQDLGNDNLSVISDLPEDIFEDYLNGNFHLLNNAQAIDIGTSLVDIIVSEDIDGVSRPMGLGFDIGTYESLTALAVKIENPLSAKVTDNIVVLNWATGVEINSSHFTIERSSTMKDWLTLSSISSKKSESQYKTYDKNPPTGTIYYRLSETDLDGNNSHLGMISINFKGQINILVYPNPAINLIHLKIQPSIKSNSMNFQIYSTEGIKVLEGITEHSNIDISQLISGIYTLYINTGATYMNSKIVVH